MTRDEFGEQRFTAFCQLSAFVPRTRDRGKFISIICTTDRPDLGDRTRYGIARRSRRRMLALSRSSMHSLHQIDTENDFGRKFLIYDAKSDAPRNENHQSMKKSKEIFHFHFFFLTKLFELDICIT